MSRNKESIAGFLNDLVMHSQIQNSGKTRHEIKKENEGLTSHEIAQKAPLQKPHEYIDMYKEMYRDIRDNTSAGRDERGVFQPSLVSGSDAIGFLERKIETAIQSMEEGKKGISQGRFQNIVSAIEKIPAFMSGRTDRFQEISEHWKGLHPILDELRNSSMAKELASPPQVTRAYNNPKAVVNAITNERAKFVAEMQQRLGLRVDNARSFVINPNGTISFFSKGHMSHKNYAIPQDLHARALALNNGKYGRAEILPYRTYLNNLESACRKVGETYSGSHSFRHSFARSMYHRLLAEGKSVIEAKAAVSEALFHRRIDIVDCYLR